MLDPGGYGAVTITKSITISGDGTLASILASLTTGVIVNAGASDVVILRNLSINGAGTGFDGIRYLAGGSLVVEDCEISGFTGNNINVNLSGPGNLVVKGTTTVGGLRGIRINTSSGRVNASLSNLVISNAGTGINTASGYTSLTNSVVTNSRYYGLLAHGGQVAIDNSTFSGNDVAIESQLASTVRVSNTHMFNNTYGFGCGGGTLASAGNNHEGGNTGGSCTPTTTVNVQ